MGQGQNWQNGQNSSSTQSLRRTVRESASVIHRCNPQCSDGEQKVTARELEAGHDRQAGQSGQQGKSDPCQRAVPAYDDMPRLFYSAHAQVREHKSYRKSDFWPCENSCGIMDLS